MQKDRVIVRKRIAGIFNDSLVSEIGFMLVCCVLGIFTKKIINPYANVVTDALHVPGGISTGVSLMFLVIAAGVNTRRGNASIMSILQAAAAMSIGMVGSMGFLLPLAYLIPGVMIDIVMLIPGKNRMAVRLKAFIANIVGSLAAAIFADIVVFHLPLNALAVYLGLAALSGAIAGFLAGEITLALIKVKRGKDRE